LANSVLDEGIQEAIGGRISCLTTVTYCSCNGREGNKEIERSVRESAVEVPGSGNLRFDDCIPLIEIHLLKKNILTKLVEFDDATFAYLRGGPLQRE
jgi:hypothetical protein